MDNFTNNYNQWYFFHDVDFDQPVPIQDHITLFLSSLHWLPVGFRVDFKILLKTFKAQCSLAPSYITNIKPLQAKAQLEVLRQGCSRIPAND